MFARGSLLIFPTEDRGSRDRPTQLANNVASHQCVRYPRYTLLSYLPAEPR